MNWGQRAGSGQISKTEPRSADGEDARGERRKTDSSPEALGLIQVCAAEEGKGSSCD